ncbi:MAG: metallo-mystery pair system four-Cys motif protein [Proteobacteria bacterium]|nr:metallo-mystery pair system four-Cys motif protein [Pseudomonadota bacterium]
MTVSSSFRRTVLAGLVLAAGTAAPVFAPALAQADKPVTIRFAASVGDKPFACGRSFDGVGATRSRVTPSDFRFYVSDVALVDATGKAVPLKLDQDERWQHRTVALLDFEDRSGPCLTGTQETRDVVTGTVPAGDYRGLRFTLGVPFELNHADATIAPSPLNLTTLFWNWQAGYKFLRIDLATSGRPQDIKPGDMPKFGDRAASNRLGFAIHLGSTVCAADSPTKAPANCANPNRPVIEFASFDPARDVVVADLGAVLEGVDVDTNQAESPAGCMSTPNDGDCNPLMRNFGLTFAGQGGQQKFFRVQR